MQVQPYVSIASCLSELIEVGIMPIVFSGRRYTMNASKRFRAALRNTAPLLLALLLTVAVAGSALAQGPPAAPGGPPDNPNLNNPSSNPPVQPPSSPPSNPPSNGPGTNQPNTNPPGTNQPGTNQPGTNQPGTNPQPQPQPHPSAPFTPPANCIVAHAATPAQLCPIDGGLQYYFIGADGSAQPGPWIRPFSELAALASASVYSGTNAKTGKSVTITYLAAENMIRVSTFYPDNEYDTDKPYNFTVDSDHNVSHEAW